VPRDLQEVAVTTSSGFFPTDIAGLPEAPPPEVVELGDGDEFDLRIGPVAKRLGDARSRNVKPRPRPSVASRRGSTRLRLAFGRLRCLAGTSPEAPCPH
jgi:hypothetical protein